jgi:hypothetical protein
MNVNMPAFNPVMPATTNPVMPTPTDRLGGGGTAVEMETARPVSDAQETQQSNPNPGQNTPQNAQDEGSQAAAARDDAALAAEARLQVAREGSDTPQGAAVDAGSLNPAPANEAPQGQLNEVQTSQQGQDNPAGRPDSEQAALQQRLEERLERAVDVAAPQAQEARSTLNEVV